MTRIVCISDTHTFHREVKIPDGDILIHAGDFTGTGKWSEIEDFVSWLKVQPHPHKVVIAGNHDQTFESHPSRAREYFPQGIYLQDSERMVRGLNVYGTPWQPKFFNWAFNLERNSSQIRGKWQKIPGRNDQTGEGIDILVTHTPPFSVLDHTNRDGRQGCEMLALELPRIRPRLHVFGHLHAGYGVVERDGTIFVNACICTDQYEPIREPIVIDLEVKRDEDGSKEDQVEEDQA